MIDVSKIMELKKKIDKQQEKVDKEKDLLFKYKDELKSNCDHPATETEIYNTDDDYGKHFYSLRWKKCIFCETKFDKEISYGYGGAWKSSDI